MDNTFIQSHALDDGSTVYWSGLWDDAAHTRQIILDSYVIEPIGQGEDNESIEA